MMLQGMTVQYLLRQTYPLKGGETILFHAAAGGIGLIACQWAKALGVSMIGTVSTDEKAALAKAHGCAHVINYKTENFVERVKEITGGKGVPVVYDSIGKDTFTGSLDCLQPRGLMVSFGNASGPVAPFGTGELASRGSLYLTRPSLGHYTATRATLDATAAEPFAMVESGKIKIDINQRYALKDVAQAQQLIADQLGIITVFQTAFLLWCRCKYERLVTERCWPRMKRNHITGNSAGTAA